jgi:hypothetical protein
MNSTLRIFLRLPRLVRAKLLELDLHQDARRVRAVFGYWQETLDDIADVVLYVDYEKWLVAHYASEEISYPVEQYTLGMISIETLKVIFDDESLRRERAECYADTYYLHHQGVIDDDKLRARLDFASRRFA